MFGKVFGKGSNENHCAAMGSKLVEYLDGRARPADRYAVEKHLSECPACQLRADEFRAVWSALDDLPAISPSPAFDASLRARIAAEPARRNFWTWIPSPRLVFAVTALVVLSVWLARMPSPLPYSSNPSIANQPSQASQVSADSDFGMIKDLPVLENFDVVSKFDALSELPAPPTASTPEIKKETR